jgi:hypothetical protein
VAEETSKRVPLIQKINRGEITSVQQVDVIHAHTLSLTHTSTLIHTCVFVCVCVCVCVCMYVRSGTYS